MSLKPAAPDGVVLVLLAIAGVLLLSGLGNGCLWQDEAETAVLARNTLRFGYPRAFDGQSWVEVDWLGYGPGEAWVYSPWLPFYLLAGVFALAGESTAIARLPFALFGLASVYLTWQLARLLTGDRRVQRLSVALLICSVPFLLHMRQCRYYAMGTALLMATCCAYLRWLNDPSLKRAVVLGLVLVLLFHTNFGTFVPVFAAVVVHQAVWGLRAGWRRCAAACAIVAGLTIPWALFFYRSAFVGAFSLGRAADHLEYYVRVTNKYLAPLAFMAGVSALGWLTRRSERWRGRPATVRAPAPAVWRFLILMVGAQALFLLVPDQRHMRYLIPTLPLLLIGEAWWIAVWITRARIMGWLFVLLALFTNVLQSPHVRIPLMDLAYELTHEYRGPMDGVIGYLRGHARPGETAKIPYDDRTLVFYTGLAVERPSKFQQESYPDWVIIRRDWIPGEFFTSGYFKRIEAAYDRIELDAPDLLWQNREDPGSHHFRTVQNASPVVIYRKRNVYHG